MDDDQFELGEPAPEIAPVEAAKQLRPYQVAGIEGIRDSLRQGNKRIILYLPTGGGKTELAQGLLEGALSKEKRAAFVCHRIELVKQTSRRFSKAGLHHGIMQGANSRGEWNRLIIGSVQTIARRGIEDLDLIIVDEAHGCAGTKAYHALFEKFKDKPIIGLTATPFSKGLAKNYPGLGGGPLFEDIVVAATIPELIQGGFLVDCDIYGPSDPDLSKVRVVAGEYQMDDLGEAVNQPKLIGDIVEHWSKLGQNQQTICFATDIAHSKKIVDEFNASGIPANHIDAYTKEADRDRIIGDFRDGQFTVLSNVAVLAEGFDAPAVGVMILARPTKSLVRYIQMAGRVLRPFPGKDRAIILDHSGTCRRLGFPTEELDLSLDDGKPKVSTSTAKKRMRLPTVCVSCYFLKPAGVHECPKCKFKPTKQSEIEATDGDLEKMERKRQRGNTLPEDHRQLYAELKYIAEQRAYKPAWCKFKFREAAGYDAPRDWASMPSQPACAGTASWVRSRNIAWAKSRNNPANG